MERNGEVKREIKEKRKGEKKRRLRERGKEGREFDENISEGGGRKRKNRF